MNKIENTKECGLCHKIQPTSEFYKYHRNKDKLHTYCKSCFVIRNKNYVRSGRNLNLTYGISQDELLKLFHQQDEKCAICRKEIFLASGTEQKKRACIDHVEGTTHIRGILCHKCNFGIGHLNHDANLLIKAAEYVSKPPVYIGDRKKIGKMHSQDWNISQSIINESELIVEF